MYSEDELNESPPSPPQLEKLGRLVMTNEPRVTNFPIEWDTAVGSNTLGIVPIEQLENFNPDSGFGCPADKQAMYDEDRKAMFSDQNVQNAADQLKSPFGNVTNQ